MRIVQLWQAKLERRVALVDEDRLRLLHRYRSAYELAQTAIREKKPLIAAVQDALSTESLDYDSIYEGRSEWSLAPAFDHPGGDGSCLISGTGLTHLASAKNRDSMHAEPKKMPLTDSMRMYQWGVEGGRPADSSIGVQPEWFYKGNGSILRGHGELLVVPAFADDGGEEGELAGIYIIDHQGTPRRVGMAAGNEFSDHQMERKNYLYLAPSKLRTCAIGPELVLAPDFSSVSGAVRIERRGQTVWSKTLASGEANMSHSLRNLEHHHFKYPAHRTPGDVHVHFFGAGAFSFGEGVALEDQDVMEVSFEGFGRPLRNPIRIDRTPQPLVEVKTL
ncbi:MAG: AraD1 family protein [Bryobacteraceae bacterium]